jgi:eukaryotic-like serine/threonine-protein kinase
MTEREIFFEALEMPTPEARAAYLEGVCSRDFTLRRKVDELLKEHFSNDSLLTGPALDGDRPGIVESPVEESPVQMLGRYKLLEKIGEGGFGEVWMAEQREPVKRRVALKIIKLGMDSRQIVARFEAERQALAMMDHANIARIFDADVTDTGRLYFVMELVRGIRITEYCDENQLPTRERLDLFIKVCQAIQHAHQKGIIHRDIKPSNILVTLHDGVPVPKVIDFGIAKATQGELTDKTVFTQFQQFIGTPAYISPEQAEMTGLDIDTRADIYSLGVLLYELLVGQTPFDAKEMMHGGLDALRQIIREKEPLRPSTKLNTLQGDARTTAGKRRQTEVGRLVHQLQGDLDWIVMKCLEKDRTRRYETANGLAMDIQRHMNNEPVVARPPSAGYRLSKLVRKHRRSVAAAVGFVLLLTAATVVSLVLALWANRERERAERATEAEASHRQHAVEQEGIAIAARQQAEREAEQARLNAYAADMAAANSAWRESDAGRARQLLSFYEDPPKNQNDFRGFDWFFLRNATAGLELGSFEADAVGVWGLEFEPSGQRFWTGAGRRLRLWEASTFRLLKEWPLPFDSVGSMTLASDGSLGAIWAEDRTVLLDLGSGQIRASIPRSSNHGCGQFLNREPIFIDGCRSRVVVWHYESGEQAILPEAVTSLTLSPDEELLATRWSSNRADILLWSTRRWGLVSHLRPPSDAPTFGWRDLAFSHHGRWLAAGNGAGEMTVWDVTTGAVLMYWTNSPRSFVLGVRFAPDDSRLVAVNSAQEVRVWETTNWSSSFVLQGHLNEVWSVAFTPDGTRLFTGDKDGMVKVWDPATQPRKNRYIFEQSCSAWLSPDGLRLHAVTDNRTNWVAYNCDLTKGQTVRTQESRSTGVTAYSVSPDGRWLATALRDGNVAVRSLTDGTQMTIHSTGVVNGILFQCDGKAMWLRTTDSKLSLLSCPELKWIRSFSSSGAPLLASPELLVMLDPANRKKIRLLSSRDGQELSPLDAHEYGVLTLVMTPDGRWLVSGGSDGLVCLWSLAEPRLHWRQRTQLDGAAAVAISPDAQTIAAYSQASKTVSLWHVPTKRRTGVLPSATRDLNAIGFSANGRVLFGLGPWDSGHAAVELWPGTSDHR